MKNVFDVANTKYNKEQLTQFAKESSQYLLGILMEGEVDIPQFVGELAKHCMERKEIRAYLKILRYCRRTGHALPDHYNEIATDNDSFDFYCRQLLHSFIELGADSAA